MKTLICQTCDVHIDEHPASRCLDAWVAESVMGWEKKNIWVYSEEREMLIGPDGIRYADDYPHYSRDLDVAWQLLEKLTQHYEVNVSQDDDVLVSCLFVMGGIADFDRWYLATASTVPLAICRAAIMSMEAK